MRPTDIQVEKLQQFAGHRSAVYCIAARDKNGFYTGSGDGIIASWFYDHPEQASALAQVPGNIFSIAQQVQNHLLAVGDMNGGIYIVDTSSKQVLRNLGVNSASVYDLLFTGNYLMAASGDGVIRRWNLHSFEKEKEVLLSNKNIRNILHIDSLSSFAFSCSDHSIYITDDNLNVTRVLREHTNSVFCTAYHPGQKYLLSGSRDATLLVWDAMDSFRLQQKIEAHLFTINDIRFSPDYKLFATAGRDKHIKIWDASNFTLLKVLDAEKYGGHINSVNKLFWNPDDNCLISCGDDRLAIRWRISYT